MYVCVYERDNANCLFPICISHRQESCILVQAFFSITMGPDGLATTSAKWPPTHEPGSSQERLERAVVQEGFCASPVVFSNPFPGGFGHQPAVFSILETTLDPHGDPNVMLYGCVCSKGLNISSAGFAVAGRAAGQQGVLSDSSNMACPGNV